MFKLSDNIHGKPKREILIPSKGSAFTPYHIFVQSSNTPPRKKARLGEKAPSEKLPSEQSCDVILDDALSDARASSCIVM